MAAAPAWTHLVKGMALYVLGDYAAALPEAQAGRTCCAGFGPALLAAVEGQRGQAEAANASEKLASRENTRNSGNSSRLEIRCYHHSGHCSARQKSRKSA
jgi:hypothetical protein